jgi:CheY-like chemotaxis protein
VARILLLEDEEILVENIPLLLKERGLEVVGITSIDRALELLGREDFDMVLLDIMMPPTEDMDAEKVDYGRETGVEVARRMKAVKPDVPIIAFTVLTDPQIQAEMREAGIIEVINKPVEPDQIADKLWQVLWARK